MSDPTELDLSLISEHEFLEPLASDVKEKLPEELEEAWQRLLLDREPEKIRRALRLYLSGSASVDDAAAAAHVDSRRVRLWLRRLAVYSPAWASKQVVNAHKRVALLALEELERRMLSPRIQDEKAFHPMTLNALAGTSTDKVARGEGWGQEKPPEGPTYASALEKLAEGLRAGNVSLKIEVAAPQTEPPWEGSPLRLPA